MYLDHFELKELPFGLTPDPDFVFESHAHKEARDVLLLSLHSGEGFIKVTGEVGVGKTLACRMLREELNPEIFLTAWLSNPCLRPRTLLLALAMQMKILVRPEWSEHDLLTSLNRAFARHSERGGRVVVILDEAQAMPPETLECLRLLTNLETDKQKLVQLVLFGQPELDLLLQRRDLRQLLQRITCQYELKGLEPGETARYIDHRMRRAGGHRSYFDANAMREIHRASGGIPRLVNVLAHKSLLLAFGRGADQVDVDMVRVAIEDTPAIKKTGAIRRVTLREWLQWWTQRIPGLKRQSNARRHLAGV